MPESKLGTWHNSDSAWTFQKARWYIFECQLSPRLRILPYPNLVEITQSHVRLLFGQLDQICTKGIHKAQKRRPSPECSCSMWTSFRLGTRSVAINQLASSKRGGPDSSTNNWSAWGSQHRGGRQAVVLFAVV